MQFAPNFFIAAPHLQAYFQVLVVVLLRKAPWMLRHCNL